MTRIKICGLTSIEQACACVALGVDALGVNLVESSLRCVSAHTARAIVQAIGARALIVGVVADMSVDAMRRLRDETGVGCLQLHGKESPETVLALLPHAYKAVGVAGAEDVAYAETMGGDYVMVDAKVDGALGGTGRRVDTRLVAALAARRRLVLAGGLTPENVGQTIREVAPWCVDAASGVEHSPGQKDLARVQAFVEAVRSSDADAVRRRS